MNTLSLTMLELGAMATVLSLAIGLPIKWVNEKIAVLNHRMNNERQRTDSLEHFRTQDVERIARMEAQFEYLKESNSRIETKLDLIVAGGQSRAR